MEHLQVTEREELDQVKEAGTLTTPVNHELPQFPPWYGVETDHGHYLE